MERALQAGIGYYSSLTSSHMCLAQCCGLQPYFSQSILLLTAATCCPSHLGRFFLVPPSSQTPSPSIALSNSLRQNESLAESLISIPETFYMPFLYHLSHLLKLIHLQVSSWRTVIPLKAETMSYLYLEALRCMPYIVGTQ